MMIMNSWRHLASSRVLRLPIQNQTSSLLPGLIGIDARGFASTTDDADEKHQAPTTRRSSAIRLKSKPEKLNAATKNDEDLQNYGRKFELQGDYSQEAAEVKGKVVVGGKGIDIDFDAEDDDGDEPPPRKQTDRSAKSDRYQRGDRGGWDSTDRPKEFHRKPRDDFRQPRAERRDFDNKSDRLSRDDRSDRRGDRGDDMRSVFSRGESRDRDSFDKSGDRPSSFFERNGDRRGSARSDFSERRGKLPFWDSSSFRRGGEGASSFQSGNQRSSRPTVEEFERRDGRQSFGGRTTLRSTEGFQRDGTKGRPASEEFRGSQKSKRMDDVFGDDFDPFASKQQGTRSDTAKPRNFEPNSPKQAFSIDSALSASADGRRVELAVANLTKAVENEDDDLDAQVRRSVEAARKSKKKDTSSSGRSKLSSSSAKAPVPQQLEDETYGEKIEPSSPEHELYYGRHPVEVALRWIDTPTLQSGRLIVQEGSESQGGAEMKLARELGVRVEIASKMRMNEAVGQPPRPHQGLLLDLPRFDFKNIKKETVIGVPETVGKDEQLFVLALDEVLDPMNMGAILRSAHFFNVFAVLASTKNSSPITSTVVKASAGSAFVLNAEKRLLGSRNIVAALQAHKAAGWRVVGTTASSDSSSGAKPIMDAAKLDKQPRTIIVMGNEETGLRSLVKAECDAFIHLPRPSRPPATLASTHDAQGTSPALPTTEQKRVEDAIALNVSAATSAIFSRLRM